MAVSHGLSAYRGDIVLEVPGYRIERQLGRGSRGVVYLAEDLQLRRKATLKILAPTMADDELFRKRFDRESQSAANLDHPSGENRDRNGGRQGRDSDGQSGGDGSFNTGGQDLQQQIDNAVKLVIQQQANVESHDLRQQIKDSVRNSIQRQSNVKGQDLQKLINNAINRAIQQAGHGQR